MVKLLCLRGYPGSGKTTWAKEWQAEDPNSRVLTSRDDLRETLFQEQGILSGDKETLITKVQRSIVESALKADKDVCVHDTNLRVKYLKDWADLAADLNADFEVKDFEVSADMCIERDFGRWENDERSVGSDVILKMAQKFPYPFKPVSARPKEKLSIEPYIGEPGLPDIVLCDIDGTIATFGDRNPFQWDKVGGDLPKDEIIHIVQLLAMQHEVIFFSGRDSVCFNETRDWLYKYVDIYNPKLFMRPEGDNRKDSIIKLELFNQHIRGKYNVAAVIDDRPAVCAMWRELGLPLFQVGLGDSQPF